MGAWATMWGRRASLSAMELRWLSVNLFVMTGYVLGWADIIPGLIGFRDGPWRVVNALGNLHVLWLGWHFPGWLLARTPAFRLNRCEIHLWFIVICMFLHVVWNALRPVRPEDEGFFQIMVPLVCSALLDVPSLYLAAGWAVLVP
ncbi:hypothetical protein HYH03_010070, partial [Edaphochlamys debaryana]